MFVSVLKRNMKLVFIKKSIETDAKKIMKYEI